MFRKRLIPIVVLGLLLSSLLLAACDGTRVNVDVDPETGQGTIDIVGGDGAEDGDTSGDSSSGETSNEDDTGLENAIIFATVIALLLGVTAIVVSMANRPRHQA